MNNELENNIKKKIGNHSGFSIPENYIAGIEDDFFIKIKEQQFPESTSFKTPDRYFDNLEEVILAKTKAPQKRGKLISFKSKFFKLIPTTVAATILLFVGFQFFNEKTYNTTLDHISYSDIEGWFEETTTTEFAINFEDDIDYEELNLTAVNINNDAIEDYFNAIDYSDLLNETP